MARATPRGYSQQPRSRVRSEPREPPPCNHRVGLRGRTRMAGRRLVPLGGPSAPQEPPYDVEYPPSSSQPSQMTCSHVHYVALPAAEPILSSEEPINYTVPVNPPEQPPPQQYGPEQRAVNPTYRVSSRTIIREFMRFPLEGQPPPQPPPAQEETKPKESKGLSDVDSEARMLAYLIFCDEGRKTADEIFKEVIDTKDRKPTEIQLRGSKPPPWFPGYFHALTSTGDLASSAHPRDVMQQAWKAKA